MIQQIDFLADKKTLAPKLEQSIGDDEMDSITSVKAPSAFKTISETAKILGVPQHVLRFWESRFRQVKPLKLKGGRRYYRPEDIELLQHIQTLLYKQGYTIKGARKALDGVRRNKLEQIAHAMPEAMEEVEAANTEQSLDDIRSELVGLREILRDAMKD